MTINEATPHETGRPARRSRTWLGLIAATSLTAMVLGGTGAAAMASAAQGTPAQRPAEDPTTPAATDSTTAPNPDPTTPSTTDETTAPNPDPSTTTVGCAGLTQTPAPGCPTPTPTTSTAVATPTGAPAAGGGGTARSNATFVTTLTAALILAPIGIALTRRRHLTHE
ncbi:hypothetical protein ACNTMW_23915 [Planosporangium sp. 12N6]|uniref:hypothetical protein n=1 Tax=Planosporangium spinosum TaxID=3402278 RepID=UPI003CF3C931